MAPRATRFASTALSLGVLALFPACGGGEASNARVDPGRDAGGHAGRQSSRPDAGPEGTGGTQGIAGSSDGAVDCNANRAPGIPINAGTLSANVDSQILSGSASILWAAGANMLTLKAGDGSALTIVFPGCEAKSYSIPTSAAPQDAISIRYTVGGDGGGGPLWACSYEDTALAPAHCTVDVTAYGSQLNAPVTGTFSGLLRLKSGAGTGTKTVSAGTFTFERP